MGVCDGSGVEGQLWNQIFQLHLGMAHARPSGYATFLQNSLSASLTTIGADNSTKVVWSQNVTSNSFAFTPSDDSSFWPTTTTPNMTHFEAVGYGSGRNQFRISETGTLNTSDSMTYDLSRPFMMRQFWHDRTVQWRLEGDDALLDKANKIHTYLVVGMVLSALVAGLAAWLVGRWFERRSLGRIGGQGKARAFEQMR